jgi:hypothetical protein
VIIVRRRVSLPFESALLASAIMYFLPYFFLSLTPNYRFIYWSVLATSVAGVLVALRLVVEHYDVARRRGVPVTTGERERAAAES